MVKEKLVDGEVKVKHSISKGSRHFAFRAFWGVFFLVAAAVILMQSFGILKLGVNMGVMVALLALLGLTVAFMIKTFWMGAFMAAAGGVVVASNAGLIGELTGEQTGMMFAAAALAATAFHILFFRRKKHTYAKFSKDGTEGANVNFTGATKRFNDQAFEKASLSCAFGSIKAHFSEAKLKGTTATIYIDNNFGGVELYLPKHWAVTNELDMSFGGVDEKNQPTITADSPQITLVGEVNFGGVLITYV
jgi:predicted membrane protein